MIARVVIAVALGFVVAGAPGSVSRYLTLSKKQNPCLASALTVPGLSTWARVPPSMSSECQCSWPSSAYCMAIEVALSVWPPPVL